MSALAFALVLIGAAIVLAVVTSLIHWWLHRACAWCHQGPATLEHYLAAHSGGAR